MLLWIKCSLNLACCHFRQGLYRACVAQCDSLLEGGPQCGWMGGVECWRQTGQLG